MNRQPCCMCGEMMLNAIPRKSEITGKTMYICEDCAEDKIKSNHQRRAFIRTFPAEIADIQYHGGLFHRDEW